MRDLVPAFSDLAALSVVPAAPAGISAGAVGTYVAASRAPAWVLVPAFSVLAAPAGILTGAVGLYASAAVAPVPAGISAGTAGTYVTAARPPVPAYSVLAAPAGIFCRCYWLTCSCCGGSCRSLP